MTHSLPKGPFGGNWEKTIVRNGGVNYDDMTVVYGEESHKWNSRVVIYSMKADYISHYDFVSAKDCRRFQEKMYPCLTDYDLLGILVCISNLQKAGLTDIDRTGYTHNQPDQWLQRESVMY